MNTEIQFMRTTLQGVLEKDPWFGRSVYSLLNEIDAAKAFIKPSPVAHSLIELLYHMNTWALFTQKRLEKAPDLDVQETEMLDWRVIDPAVHTWEKALEEFKAVHERILELLNEADDHLLNETVDYRKYNFRFLLNGLIQHDIYHLGQIAYLHKMIVDNKIENSNR
jgi:uncharacterized damage-inducible protein DinB